MKIIFNTEWISMHRKYGNSTFLVLTYRLIKNSFLFFALFAWGFVFSLCIETEYITSFTYEQIVIVIMLLYGLFLKKENQYAITPYLIRIPEIEIRKYIFIKESISTYNFWVLPLIIPLLLMNGIEWSASKFILLFINTFLVGLFLNLFVRIVKFFCNQQRLCYLITMAILSMYIIILVITRQKIVEFSYLNWLAHYYSTIGLFIGVSLIIPFYMYVIKQEMYLIYDNNRRNESIYLFGLQSITNNPFNKLFVLQLIRSKGAQKFLRAILLCVIVGLLNYWFDFFKLMGLAIYLGAYTLNMLQFTIYLHSDYFDALYTQPISIKSLLLNAFYTNVCIVSVLFLLLFIYIVIYDYSFILPAIAVYLYISGPLALILFFNILFAKHYDLDAVESEFTVRRTFAQKIIGGIAGGSLFGILAIIHFLPTIGCYIIIAISIAVILMHHYWIGYLYEQFMNRKYKIMNNLRK